MRASEKLRDEHLRRRGVVYVRQSSAFQVAHNLESQRRQYGLTALAQGLGFAEVEVIDEDLGRSGAGTEARPGFERLVSAVCSGSVGAVLCLEASRLARNGRDWHHLIELCALVGAVLIDPEGVYDPKQSNDRLLLGLKGTMSEFELTLLRQRSKEAKDAMARRGELRFRLPVGLCWQSDGIQLDPNRRVQQALRLVFDKYAELGSARQVMLWMQQEGLSLPRRQFAEGRESVSWRPAAHHQVVNMVKNPLYAGAYAHGRCVTKTRIDQGRIRKNVSRKAQDQWDVLIVDHHPGYISWQQFERNQRTLAENAHMQARMRSTAGRGGKALLSGMLRCGVCGRKLGVRYRTAGCHRYECRADRLTRDAVRCLGFGGRAVDEAVSRMVLRAVQGPAIDAAIEAAQRDDSQVQAQVKSLELELQQANYDARLAMRQYEAVDPDNRLVAAELEARWNDALAAAKRIQSKLQHLQAQQEGPPIPDRATLLGLASNLDLVWNDPSTEMRLKQRIVRVMIREVIAKPDPEEDTLQLIVHWTGGRHTEVRVAKRSRSSLHTDTAAVEILERMAGQFPDSTIAATLNRSGLRTGYGQPWKVQSVQTARYNRGLAAYDPQRARAEETLTLQQAASLLNVHHNTVRRLIARGILPASQPVRYAPWTIEAVHLKLPAVQRELARRRTPPHNSDNSQLSMFSKA